MDLLSPQSWALWLLAALGAYLGAYAAEKGKRRAAREDSKQIRDELTQTTSTLKLIEAKISSDLWDRQMHWTQRRDAYARLIDTTQALETAFRDAFNSRVSFGEYPAGPRNPFAQAAERVAGAMSEFRRASALAMLFASPVAKQAVNAIWESVAQFRYPPGAATDGSYAPLNEALSSLQGIAVGDIEASKEDLLAAAIRHLGLQS